MLTVKIHNASIQHTTGGIESSVDEYISLVKGLIANGEPLVVAGRNATTIIGPGALSNSFINITEDAEDTE